MGVKKKQRPRQSLAAGRPPTVKRPKSITRKATKSLIGTIHVLEKRRIQAAAQGDVAEEARVVAEIEALGGLKKYQEASLQGQREDRGGDSSRVLMDWLREDGIPSSTPRDTERISMLEVGALSIDNACSKSGLFDIQRIDLNSQGEGILQQDFMQRPLPVDESEKFDIVSLSLVLNFVPEPRGRGQMLRRTLQFLKAPHTYSNQSASSLFPSLFLVLPAPCVTNSRYLDEERLEAILASLGYAKVKSKLTQRLVYYLWKRDVKAPVRGQSFAKKELRPGGARNNFAIVLKQEGQASGQG
jgi:25S rRNA (adenine2142-N1)-methyltransferase